jgi:hypothetical protein
MPHTSEDQWDYLYVYAKNLADNHVSFDEIEKQLLQKTTDESLVVEIIKQLKKIKYAIKRKSGVVKIIFASVFLFVGFFITCVNFHSNQSFTNVMFGFTTLGLLLLFWGLYEVIG